MKNNHFRITTAQIAKICGVSQGTVDRALNDRSGIKKETKEQILKVAKEYGYRPNIYAKGLKEGHSHLIGIIVFDLYNEYFSNLISALEEDLNKEGYALMVMLSHKNPAKERECVEKLYFMGADGIVLCPINKGAEFSAYVKSFNLPAVTVGNALESIPYVGIDNYQAMRDAAQFIFEKGYTFVQYVAPPVLKKPDCNVSAPLARLHGFRDCAEQAGAAYTICFGEQAVQPPQPGSAILCSSDYYALRLAQQFGKTQGIMGFDDISVLKDFGVPLDSVAYDIAGLSRAVTDRLLGRQHDSFYVRHTLKKRGSI